MTKNLFAMIALGAGMAGIAMAQAAAPAAAPPAAAAPAAMSAPTKVGVIQIQAALAATKEGQKAAAELEWIGAKAPGGVRKANLREHLQRTRLRLFRGAPPVRAHDVRKLPTDREEWI